jgi:nucleoside-diphosphate-sugar epimerase
LALYLVTGGAGFIGSHTVEELIRRGESVRVLDHLSTGRRENLSQVLNKIDFHEGDIRDLDAIRSLFEGVNYAIHFAAASSVLRSIKEPVETTQANLMYAPHLGSGSGCSGEAHGDGSHGRDLR